jgi:hypothetical protein
MGHLLCNSAYYSISNVQDTFDVDLKWQVVPGKVVEPRGKCIITAVYSLFNLLGPAHLWTTVGAICDELAYPAQTQNLMEGHGWPHSLTWLVALPLLAPGPNMRSSSAHRLLPWWFLVANLQRGYSLLVSLISFLRLYCVVNSAFSVIIQPCQVFPESPTLFNFSMNSLQPHAHWLTGERHQMNEADMVKHYKLDFRLTYSQASVSMVRQ